MDNERHNSVIGLNFCFDHIGYYSTENPLLDLSIYFHNDVKYVRVNLVKDVKKYL